jgi:hypothetical protein
MRCQWPTPFLATTAIGGPHAGTSAPRQQPRHPRQPEQILLKVLAKEPARYRTADQSGAFDDYLSGIPGASGSGPAVSPALRPPEQGPPVLPNTLDSSPSSAAQILRKAGIAPQPAHSFPSCRVAPESFKLTARRNPLDFDWITPLDCCYPGCRRLIPFSIWVLGAILFYNLCSPPTCLHLHPFRRFCPPGRTDGTWRRRQSTSISMS